MIDYISQNAHHIIPWLILLLPLGGFTVLALFGDAIKRDKEENGAAIAACGVVLGSFALSVWAVVSMLHLPAGEGGLRFAQPLLGREGTMAEGLTWIEAGSFRIPFSLLLDPLSAVMILTVTGVGSLIHIYSLGYMAHDEERVRYFSYLNLFTFFMLLLVLGGSLPILFVGWEGVGLCSYLLIGFWFKKKSASDAGMKAFIVNRVGDAGLILGMILAFHSWGSLDLVDLAEHAASIPREALGVFGTLTVVCLLLFVGATGKSAQIPLHVWLPDAMEGPTPVSALIHAATMVTAGVYMVARLSPLFARSATALAVVATIGAATALMAATIALVQTDIKKVLAYSTVSQLGYMFLACGVGAFGVGIFHLFTHAFFKALLFLGSGSVIHAMSGEQDMRKMGGLRAKIPVTFWTFAVGTAAIAGIPFLAGYYSKDEILASALTSGHRLLFGIGLFTALLTAFYMSRLLFLTFFGSFRGSHEAEHHVHESPWTMLGPLVVLAVGCFVVGRLHIPAFVHPVLRLPEAAEVPEPVWVTPVAVVSALAGIIGAFYLYVTYVGIPDRIAATFRPLYRLFEAKYFFDDAYNWFASRVVVDGSSGFLWKRFDASWIDGIVNGAASVTDAFSKRVRFVQTGFLRGYALVILGGAVALLGYLLWHA
ncbi:MAG: NADH-quinone oxidoreductase subunit L [Vicinamibacteria bacterium]